MYFISIRNIFCWGIALLALFMSQSSSAGGITLTGTRVIYPEQSKQVTMSLRNTSDKSSFLVQSWVENANGEKSHDFVVAPPLYVSGPNNENTLRLIYNGNVQNKERETLYYFNVKSIPSVDKSKVSGQNVLMLAAITRIKLFYRPSGLTLPAAQAPEKMRFQRTGSGVTIENPTPYYLTLAQITIGGQKVDDRMIAPHASEQIALKSLSNNEVKFRTINDFGAVTAEIKIQLRQ